MQFLPKGGEQSDDGPSSDEGFNDGYGLPEEDIGEDDLPFA